MMAPRSRRRKRPASPTPEDLVGSDQCESIQDAFAIALEKSGNPEGLTVSRTKRTLRKLGILAEKEDIVNYLSRRQATNEVDEPVVNEEAFVKFAANKVVQAEKAEKAFQLFDKDNKGMVLVEDLRRVAQELGESFTDEELEEMVELFDRSGGDGFLGPEDFIRIAAKVNL